MLSGLSQRNIESRHSCSTFIAFILAFGIVKVYPWIDYREKTYPRVPIYAGILIPLKLIDGGSVANDVKIRIGNSNVFF
jgi:hypothetical protein